MLNLFLEVKVKNTVSSIIVCAGSSTRMGGTDKIFENVCGIPLVGHTLKAFEASNLITDIIVVTRPERIDRIESLAHLLGIRKLKTVVCGGKTRFESVFKGTLCSDSEFVAITDGARPLITPDEIDMTCNAAIETGAAALGIRMTDTVKRVNENDRILQTVDRSELVRIQTPQIFRRDEYVSAACEAKTKGMQFTDDCAIYEHFGKPVKVVYGTAKNIKVTYKEDIEMCERLMSANAMPRIGHGYDVHRLTAGRKLILCGQEIEFTLGLSGHSDADVALHALMDAMLGAAAAGDIGELFPDTDASYKDISSMTLLEKVKSKVYKDYTFGNCDITIIAQKPKLAPYIPQMRENIAKVLEADVSQINVKATTEEKLGFTGSLEGISAHAVCILYKR